MGKSSQIFPIFSFEGFPKGMGILGGGGCLRERKGSHTATFIGYWAGGNLSLQLQLEDNLDNTYSSIT